MTSDRRRPPLDKQVVVITGASQGIGRETALLFGRRGALVVAAARNEEALRTLADEIERSGGRAESVTIDVSDFPEVERLADRAIERFGRIDTWINNAAVSAYARVTDLSREELDRIVRVNLLGQMYGSKIAAERMTTAGGGAITPASVAGSSMFAMSAAGLFCPTPALYAQCSCHKSWKPGDLRSV